MACRLRSVGAWLVVLGLLCLLTILPLGAAWAASRLAGCEALKWIGASLGLLGSAVAIRSAEPPGIRVRAAHCCLIVAITAAVASESAYLFPREVLGACWHSGADAELRALHYTIDVLDLLVTSPLAVACAAGGHPPSRYTRGAVVCVLSIWASKAGWVTHSLIDWCGDPFGTQCYVQDGLWGFSWSLTVLTSVFWVNILVVLRVEALEASLGRPSPTWLRWLVGVYFALRLANRLLEELGSKAIWLKLLFILIPLYLAAVFLRAFVRPLRLLLAEVHQVSGVPREQARWAAHRLGCEVAGALCVMLTSILKSCLRFWKYLSDSEDGDFLLSVSSTLDDLANAYGIAIMCGLVCRRRYLPSPPKTASEPLPAASWLARSQRSGPHWAAKVEELARRGFPLAALLDFYASLLEGRMMPTFNPELSTTNDVVRLAIIPLSRVTLTADDSGRPVQAIAQLAQVAAAEDDAGQQTAAPLSGPTSAVDGADLRPGTLLSGTASAADSGDAGATARAEDEAEAEAEADAGARASRGCALATVWNGGRPMLPHKMVTHSWGNKFSHLVAAIVADGLGEAGTYRAVAAALSRADGVAALRRHLEQRGALENTYWVCAFCINQHASICAGFGPPPEDDSPARGEWERKRVDTATGEPFPLCTCGERKQFNSEPLECELNKFDDLMAYLHEQMPSFSQVVAVDQGFDLFSRAWCVAELVEAEVGGIPQSVQIHSDESLDLHFEKLAFLAVQRCRASRPEDTEFILARISDVASFNTRLQWLIFGSEGLFRSCASTRDRAAILGRIVRRVSRGGAGAP